MMMVVCVRCPSALISVSSGTGRHLRCGLCSVAPVGRAAIVGLVDLGLLLHGAGLASLVWPTLCEQTHQTDELTRVKGYHVDNYNILTLEDSEAMFSVTKMTLTLMY